jgi:hypothetical protein
MESLGYSCLKDDKNKNTNNFICFPLENISYFPGDTIQGKICFNNSETFSFAKIFIKLRDIEAWRWKDKGETSTVNQKFIAEKVLDFPNNIDKDSTEETVLQPGTYEYNFHLDIPENIEPSIEFHNTNSNFVKRYDLYVIVQSQKTIAQVVQTLQIKRKYFLPKETDLIQTSSSNIKIMSIMKKGTSSLSIKLTDAVIKINDEISFQIEVNNSECKLKTDGVKIDLIRSIYFMGKDGKFKRYLEKKLKTEYIQLAIKQETKTIDYSMKLTDPEIETPLQNLKKIYSNVNNVNDVNDLMPTVDSALLKCGYYIKVTLYFESFIKRNDRPRIIIPVIAVHQNKAEVNVWELKDTLIKLGENDLIGAQKYNLGIRKFPVVDGINIDNPFTDDVNQNQLGDPFILQNDDENEHDNKMKNDNNDYYYEDPFTGQMVNGNNNEDFPFSEGNDETEMINMDDFFGFTNDNENNTEFPTNPSMYANKNKNNDDKNIIGNEESTNSMDNMDNEIAEFP